MTEGQSKYDLYEEFAQNRQRSLLRRTVPFGISTAIALPELFYSMLTESYLEGAHRYHGEIEFVTALSIVLPVTGIGVIAQLLDRTRVGSPNGKLAQQIAQIEGRNPQTQSDKQREIRYIKHTVQAARRISPTPLNMLQIDTDNFVIKFRSIRQPHLVEERAISDRRFRKWAVEATEKNEFGDPQDPSVLIDSLIIADRQWTRVVENDKQPAYKQRYGRLMKEEIRKKLAEHLR